VARRWRHHARNNDQVERSRGRRSSLVPILQMCPHTAVAKMLECVSRDRTEAAETPTGSCRRLTMKVHLLVPSPCAVDGTLIDRRERAPPAHRSPASLARICTRSNRRPRPAAPTPPRGFRYALSIMTDVTVSISDANICSFFPRVFSEMHNHGRFVLIGPCCLTFRISYDVGRRSIVFLFVRNAAGFST
jgi:hypothetical protein